MIPVVLTFRYQLPLIENFTMQGEKPKQGEVAGVIRSKAASERIRVLLCDVTPIFKAFPEILDIQDEYRRTEKLMESLGLLFHLARQKNAGKKLSNPLALAPKGTLLVNQQGETQAIWADIPPPPREMDSNAVDLFLKSVVGQGLNQLSIELKPFEVTHQEWSSFFKEGAENPSFKKEVSSENGMLQELQDACVKLAFSKGFSRQPQEPEVSQNSVSPKSPHLS